MGLTFQLAKVQKDLNPCPTFFGFNLQPQEISEKFILSMHCHCEERKRRSPANGETTLFGLAMTKNHTFSELSQRNFYKFENNFV